MGSKLISKKLMEAKSYDEIAQSTQSVLALIEEVRKTK
jgi:2-keto-3-deoxy-6-phosphogluconate aldolase